MITNIKNIRRDDNGNLISIEEYNKQRKKFEDSYKSEYEKIVNQIVEEINEKCDTDNKKLKMLFDYLTADNMKYDLRGISDDGRRANGFTYEYPPYKKWGIENNTKYAVILKHAGICCSYADAFEDICKKLGIPCKRIDGFAGMEHSWNVVNENGILKHIDVALAISGNRHYKYNYFMKTLEELHDRTANDNLENIKKELHPICNFKIKNKKPANNGFRVISIKPANEEEAVPRRR